MRTLLALIVLPAVVAAADYSPDPKAVRWHGPAYRYPQAGWIVLHIEGKPYDRGVQHGSLMATEIAACVRCFAALQGPKDPAAAWGHVRRLTGALFLRRFDREYLEEMQGIADGAAEAGAKVDGRAIDLTDVVALNCWAEIETLDGGLQALPTGLEGLPRPGKKPRAAPPAKPEHCSAFAATGPATADGKIVFGHITMFSLYPSRSFNVWLDVKPEKGHRVLMQSYPGGIQSGMDYYLTDAGLIVCETTIDQTRFRADGTPLASRVRKALQYGESIDDVVKGLTDGNNGLYTNEWLIADTKTNEIAMLELGTTATRLWRSSKKEWFGGTEGFYWGCNNTKDLRVRLDTIADLGGRPVSTAWVPAARDKKWLQFYATHKGKITAETGIEAFRTPPICAASSLDAKVTTAAMVGQLKTHAIFGPPIGGTWLPTDQEKADFPEVVPLVPNDWTVLHAGTPPKDAISKILDLGSKAEDFRPLADRMPEGLPTTKAAWHGTLLPKADADLWLTEGFTAYERIVAFERTLRDGDDDRALTAEEKERVAVELGIHRSSLLIGNTAPLSPGIDPAGDPHRDVWMRATVGAGVTVLHRLHEAVGDVAFVEGMEEFGKKHAGKPVTIGEFAAFTKARWAKDRPDYVKWLEEEAKLQRYTVRSWTHNLEETLIVYGTVADVEANREAAGQLQKAIVRRLSNVQVPVRPDTECLKPEATSGRNVLLIGGPATNRLAGQWRAAFPVTFDRGSFRVRDEQFAHPGSAVVAATTNPHGGDYSVVVIHGLGAEATYFAPEFLLSRSLRPGNVLVIPNQGRARSLLVK